MMPSACWGTRFVLGFRRSQILFRLTIAGAVLAAASCCLIACGGGGGNSGGGGGGGGNNPPPPDFTLTVPTQVTLQQGGAPQELDILDGGSDDNLSISLSFSGLASGLALYGGSTYTFPASAAGTSRNWAMAASSTAAAGASSATVTATNGSVTHTYSVNVTVTASTAYSISLSQSSLTLTPGGEGTIQATVTGTTNPEVFVTSFPLALPFDSPTIQSTGPSTYNLTFYAPLDYDAQSNIPLFVGAYVKSTTEGEAVAPLSINITQTFPAITAPTRSNVVRAGVDPDGMVYDEARKLLFVTYGLLNEVVVYSSLDQQVVATIPVPLQQLVNQEGGVIDESADGTGVYVAGPEMISIIDPVRLQVIGRQKLPFTPLPSRNISTIGWLKLATLADGNVLILNSDEHAYLWNPASGSMAEHDPASPIVVGGGESLVRSADHSTALVYSSFYAPSPAILFHSGTDTWGASMQSANNQMALNPDGSQIAAACLTTGNPIIALTFYDNSFNAVGASPQQAGSCAIGSPSAYPIFSLDGKSLYTFLPTVPIDLAWNAQTDAPLGVIDEDNYVRMWQPLAIDESGLVFGSGTMPGLFVADASHPGAIGADPSYDNGTGTEPFPFPQVTFPVAVGKGNNVFPLGQTGNATLLASGFDPSVQYSLFVGPPPGDTGAVQATGLQVTSSQDLQFTVPASNTPGPVNLTITNNAGWSETLPDAISYEPYILGVDPSAIPPSGNTAETVYGYGVSLGSATVGGAAATTNAGTSENNSDLYYPVMAMPMQTTSGTPGWADLQYSSTLGSTTLHHAMQFLKSSVNYPVSPIYSAVVYDAAHQHVFLSDTDGNQVAVFDLASSSFLPAISVGNAPTSLALTPDNSTLAVLNSTDQTASVIDTTQLKVAATLPVLTSGEQSASVVTASAVSALGAHQMAVLLSGAAYVHVLNVASGSLSCTGIAGCDATGVDLQLGFNPYSLASTPDGSKAFFNDGQGHLSLLNLAQNTLTAATAMPQESNLSAVNADGNEFAASTGIYDANLFPVSNVGGQEFYFTDGWVDATPQFSGPFALNPSGSLLFTPAGGEIHVFDVQHGADVMRIALQGSDTAVSAFALDATGTELFLATNSGFDVVQLEEAPLSIASVTPGAGSSGTAVTIRGSGFESGTTVSFGSTPASVEFTDTMTLKATVPAVTSGPVQITVKNPDGSSYSLDDAFVEN